MELQRPNFTNFDAVFCKKYIFRWNRGKAFFGGPHFNFFGGQGDLFSEATSLFQIGGSAFPERWFLCQQNHLSGNLDNRTDDHNQCSAHQKCCAALFQRGGSVPAEPPPWKSGQPGTPYHKKTALSGGKTKKKLPSVFLRLRDTHKKYILQKKSVKTAIRALSSGQSNLQTPIWGCHRQLDDQYFIWLGD